MLARKTAIGHGMALFTAVVWGVTYISSKILVTDLSPAAVIALRFPLAWLALFFCSPKPLIPESLKSELPYIGAGFTGLTLYYILQNVSLLYTTASNVGIITSAAPIFTALFLRIFCRGAPLRPLFFLGFGLAMAGIVLITLSKGGGVHLNAFGDLLALGTTMAWGGYGVFLEKIDHSTHSEIQITRKIFFWGILLCMPYLLISGGFPLGTVLHHPILWGNLLFLSLGSSALCYVIWGRAVQTIGTVTTSTYLYLIPAVSVASAALFLREPVTWFTVTAVILILAGLWLSQKGTISPVHEEESHEMTSQAGPIQI